MTLEHGDYILLAVRKAADKLSEETFLAAQKLIKDHLPHPQAGDHAAPARQGDQRTDFGFAHTPDQQEAA